MKRNFTWIRNSLTLWVKKQDPFKNNHFRFIDASKEISVYALYFSSNLPRIYLKAY